MHSTVFRLAALIATTALVAGCATPGDGTAGSAPSGAQGADPRYDANAQKAVKLSQTARGAQITFDARVLFETGKADVRGDGTVALDRVATLVKEKTTANLIVEGHTDSTGTAQVNQRLAQQRADAVRAALVTRGVAATRIQARGIGPSQPVADNATEQGRALNRRVEIVMLGESAERIGGKAEEERLASGLEKFLKNAEGMVRGVFDKLTGGDAKPQQ